MAPRAVLRVARKVSRVLSEQQVPHALAGGLAVGFHGFNRATKSVDVVVSSSARRASEQLGPTTPVSGQLKGICLNVGRVNVAFLFVAKPLRRADLTSPVQVAGLPIIGIDPLVAMKVVAGRLKDMVDAVELLKVGQVSVEKVSKRLSGKDLKQFRDLVKIAGLESQGRTKESRRITLAVFARAAGVDLKSARGEANRDLSPDDEISPQ